MKWFDLENTHDLGFDQEDIDWLNNRVNELLEITGIGEDDPRYETAVRSCIAEAMDEFTDED